MKKLKLIIAAMILGSIVIWCNSNKEQPTSSGNWIKDVSNDAFIEFINQLDSAANIGNEEEFFFDDVNSEVKIKGTNRILLVSKEHLNISSINLPETLAIQWFARRQNNNSSKNSLISSLIRWFTRERNSNSDILFEGKDIYVERSLIVDIKTAIASRSNEITQSVLDTKTTSENFSFAFTFHRFDDVYWKSPIEKNDDKFNEQRAVKVRETESDYLFALKRDLNAEFEKLPDRVQIIQARIKGASDKFQAAFSLRKNLRPTRGVSDKLQIDAELLMVPKSVLEEMRAPILRRMRGVKRDNNKWFSLVSINVAFGIPLTEAK